MNIENFLENIKRTEDNYIAVTIKPDIFTDANQFASVNSGISNLVNCTRDRYEKSSLLYFINNYISINKFLYNKSFDFIELKNVILQITDSLIELSNKKLIMANVILNPDYIFYDIYTSTIKLLYIPITTSMKTYDVVPVFQALLKGIISNIKVNGANELVGYILSNSNLKTMDILAFRNGIIDINNIASKTVEKESNPLRFYATLISFWIFLFLIPLGASLLQLQAIISMMGITVLLIVASLASLTVNVLMDGKNNKSKAIIQQEEKVLIVNDNITPSEEINITNLDMKKLTTETFGTNNADGGIEPIINNRKSQGTQLLFDEDKNEWPYLVDIGVNAVVERIYINNKHFVIGRSKTNSDFAIDEQSISKKHATIELKNEDYFLSDNNSSNGSFINGLRLAPSIENKLSSGDVIAFANHQFRYEMGR